MEATSLVALSKVHLNKFGSYFKFMSGDINLNSGPTTPTRNYMPWESLPF